MAGPAQRSSRGTPVSWLRHQLAFTVGSALALWAQYTLLRAALLAYNGDLAQQVPAGALLEAFGNGVRFDLRLVAWICLPLVFAMLSRRAMAARGWQLAWLTLLGSLSLFLGLVELDFYREFQQRLNSLFFQYLEDDPATVASMLWHGFPVLRYLAAWALGTLVLYAVLRRLDRGTRPAAGAPTAASCPRRLGVFLAVLLVTAALARGTLQQGPPLRWGAAYTTDFLFANQLGLNGTLSLVDAARQYLSDRRGARWADALDQDAALATVRTMLLAADERLVDADSAAVRRLATPPPDAALPVRNVVIILLESFAGRYVGALGGEGGITPSFDALSREGLLFTRFFANGTHTHQGMFATMACFPNLPGFEYLMQQAEGAHRFSGLPALLGPRGFDDLYLYNGDFAWDNQGGFFRNQGLRHYIGRHDFVKPVFSDPTWGVSDQDMFDRALAELQRISRGGPFYALLQTLSNHTPYALPTPLPVEAVHGFGHLDEHLTAMRYADWALGRFFDRARQLPLFRDTLFVVAGDHGFSTPEQLTDINLYRYHVPLLLLAPGLTQRYGQRVDAVGTQVDIVPTIMARLGRPFQHQCWGRDLLALAPGDPGFGVIKPSGSDQTVAIVEGDTVLVQPPTGDATLFSYTLGANADARRIEDAGSAARLWRRMAAYLQEATRALVANTAGPGS